jgi:hypothetical protein
MLFEERGESAQVVGGNIGGIGGEWLTAGLSCTQNETRSRHAADDGFRLY